MTSSPESAKTRKTRWQSYLAFPLIWKYAIALIAGGAVGLIVGPPIAVLQPLGDLFLRLLQMLVMPLIITTLIVGAASIAPARLSRIGGKIFGYYIVTSAIAVAIGILLALAVNPGTGLTMSGGENATPKAQPPITETLLNIVPKNPFQAAVEGNVLAIIFFALIVGIAIAAMRYGRNQQLREKAELVVSLADVGAEVMFRIVRGVLEYGVLGVFALLAVTLGKTGTAALVPLAKLIGVVYCSVGLQILVYCGILLIAGISLRRFFAAAKEPMITAFVTRSSSGTLPVTMRAAENVGIREGVYGFSLPLGATINMDGTALYVGAATVFVANVSGVHLGLGQLAGVVLVGVLASIGAAGVPGAGLIMLSLAITQAGLPFAAVALVAGIDAILDMVRTMCNITGDLTGTSMVAKTEPGMMREPEKPVHAIEVGAEGSSEQIRP